MYVTVRVASYVMVVYAYVQRRVSPLVRRSLRRRRSVQG